MKLLCADICPVFSFSWGGGGDGGARIPLLPEIRSHSYLSSPLFIHCIAILLACIPSEGDVWYCVLVLRSREKSIRNSFSNVALLWFTYHTKQILSRYEHVNQKNNIFPTEVLEPFVTC